MNAEIKFHQYLRMISQNPPTTPLPDDVLDLMHLTIELVDLIYWKPVPTKGSQGEAIVEMDKRRQRNTVGEIDDLTRSRRSGVAIRRKFANMNLETRKAYGRGLMSGHGTLPSFHLHESSPLNMFI
jgi:hypothetical protein